MSQRYGPSIDGDPLLIVTATGTETIQLPPGFAGGRSFFVRRTDSTGNTVTVSTVTGGSINGTTNGTKTVPGNAEVRFIAGDGNAWTSIGGATSGGTPGPGAVTSTELAAGAVTSGKIASNAVGSAEITDSSVALVDLASAVQTTLGAAGTAAQKSANLSDLASAATARTNLSLGGAATLNVGTTAGTVAAGDDSRITGAAQVTENVNVVATAGASQTIPAPTSYTQHKYTLTAATCTFTLPTAVAGQSFSVSLAQDGTGGRLAVFTSAKWAGGVAPTLSTGASKIDDLTFQCTDVSVGWKGYIAGLDMR